MKGAPNEASGRGGRSTPLAFLAFVLSIVAIVASVVALVKISSDSSNSNQLRSSVPQLQISPGIYKSYSQVNAYYFVVITAVHADVFNGWMSFRYSDGQSSVVFAFSGAGVGNAGIVTPTVFPNVGSASQSRSSIPDRLSVTLTGKAMTFGECMGYLHFVLHDTQCTFGRVTRA